MLKDTEEEGAGIYTPAQVRAIQKTREAALAAENHAQALAIAKRLVDQLVASGATSTSEAVAHAVAPIASDILTRRGWACQIKGSLSDATGCSLHVGYPDKEGPHRA